MKLKAAAVFLFSVGFILEAKAQTDANKSYAMTGVIEGYSNGPIYLSYYRGSIKKAVTDTATVKDGKFVLKGLMEEPVVAFIKVDRNNITQLFVEPGQTDISLKLNQFYDARLQGSKTQDLYNDLETKKKSIKAKYSSLLAAYKNETDPSKKEDMVASLNPYYLAIRQTDLSFFDTHPNSVVTGFVLTNNYLSKLPAAVLQEYYNKMKDGEGIMSIYKKQVGNAIEKIKRNEIGKNAIDFKKVDANKDTLTLSQFRGKYVLLDFWATWCVPCREKTPHLIELYKKYRNKGFEIVGIADDDYRAEVWKKAIKDDNIPWKNILRGQDKAKIMAGIKNPADLSELFDIHVLPTLILIDKDGLIIDRFIGNEKAENERLETKLKLIFK